MMVSNPEGFLREKLSKRTLSINTVRDALMASILLSFQRAEESKGSIPDQTWRQAFAADLRQRMVAVCEAEGIPTEYPSLVQLKNLIEKMEMGLQMDRLAPDILSMHRQNAERLLGLAEE